MILWGFFGTSSTQPISTRASRNLMTEFKIFYLIVHDLHLAVEVLSSDTGILVILFVRRANKPRGEQHDDYGNRRQRFFSISAQEGLISFYKQTVRDVNIQKCTKCGTGIGPRLESQVEGRANLWLGQEDSVKHAFQKLSQPNWIFVFGG